MLHSLREHPEQTSPLQNKKGYCAMTRYRIKTIDPVSMRCVSRGMDLSSLGEAINTLLELEDGHNRVPNGSPLIFFIVDEDGKLVPLSAITACVREEELSFWKLLAPLRGSDVSAHELRSTALGVYNQLVGERCEKPSKWESVAGALEAAMMVQEGEAREQLRARMVDAKSRAAHLRRRGAK